jgi:hypothetical protein
VVHVALSEANFWGSCLSGMLWLAMPSTGKDFARMPCQHMFCWACMQQFSDMQVKEGTVINLTCPDTSCRYVSLIKMSAGGIFPCLVLYHSCLDVSYMFKPPVNEFRKADLVVHRYQAFFVYVATHV